MKKNAQLFFTLLFKQNLFDFVAMLSTVVKCSGLPWRLLLKDSILAR